MKRPVRPLLKYNGAKWILAPWIVSQFPAHRTFVDLFAGSGAVLLSKPRAMFDILNDRDCELVRFFRVLRDWPRELLRAIRWTPYSRREWRACREPTKSDVEAARRFYVRCWLSRDNNLGTSYRLSGNLAGDGRYIPAKMLADLRPVYQAAQRIRGCQIENLTWPDAIRFFDTPETLFYVDPPYVKTTRATQRLYTHEMGGALAHARLLRALRRVQGYVVLSGYRSPLYDRALSDWRRLDRETVTDSRKVAVESLWLSPRTAAALDAENYCLFPEASQ